MNRNRAVASITAAVTAIFAATGGYSTSVVAQQSAAGPARELGNDTRCAALKSIQIPDVTIVTEMVKGGPFIAPGTNAVSPGLDNLPSFCRVVGHIQNHPTSNINFELWLPTANANGRFAQVGNGGYAGSIQYGAMAERLKAGYATANTDDGTAPSGDQSFLADPERIADFKGRSEILTAQAAKTLFGKFYGVQPNYAYFTGCSSGGLEGLAFAQRAPELFNGISAGSPAFDSAALFTQALWTYKNFQLIEDKIPVIHRAALAACDLDDGVKDGVISNPPACRFNPGTLMCKPSSAGATCLTPDQVQAVRNIYQGPVNPATGTKTGEQYAPGMPIGSELSWSGSRAQALGAAQPWYAEVLYGKRTMDLASFNFERDVQLAMEKTIPLGAQVTDPDLSRFRDHGGKLLIYVGQNDPLWSAGDIARYYREVVARQGADAAAAQNFNPQTMNPQALSKTKEFARLFMVPGMGHCGRGDGPNVFDNFGALVNWVEKNQAPDVMVATKFTNNQPAQGVERTRPICTYPLFAKWKGAGDATKAENFICVRG